VIARRTVALFALTLMACASAQAQSSTASQSSQPPTVLAQYASLPLRFEAVVAPYGAHAFVARAANYAVAITRDGAELAFADGSAIPIRLVDPSRDATVAGIARTDARIHRLRYGDARDRIDVPTYERVAISNVQPGLDVAFHGHGRELEYDVIVAPGADPSRFAFRIDGSNALALNDAGDLTLATAAGTLSVKAPVAYQDVGDTRQLVASAFYVDDEGVVRIRIGDYDATRTLVIDPVVTYATYLGGSNFQRATAVAVDGAGNVFVAGYTGSIDFPLVNAYDRSISRKGDLEVFVSKLDASGTRLLWSTYIGGGSSYDRAVGIAVDATGSVYVTGSTSGVDFPTTSNAWQKAVAGGGGFVTKLVSAGNALAYSTYVAAATPNAIAIDSAGDAYVTGNATSSFVTTTGAIQTVSGNPTGTTGFVLKLDPAGSKPLFSTFLGGSGGDDATSIAVDSHADAYIGGWTSSTDFPVRNALQPIRGIQKDGFVAKLVSDGSRLVYSTFLGGGLDDAVNAIAVDANGSAYVAGETYSGDFPVKAGFQMQKAGHNLINSSVGNAFVAKLSPAGKDLVYSSFIGGEVCATPCQTFGSVSQYRADAAYGIAVDAAGHVYVTGIARSYTFPLVDSSAPRKQEDTDDSAFALKVAISGGSLLWSTFVRTGFNETGDAWTRFPPGAAAAVAVDATGASYVVGSADSASDFPPTTGAFQTVNTSVFGPSAIVVKFAPASTMTLTTSNPATDTQTPVTLTATVSGPAASGSVTFLDGTSWVASGTFTGNNASATLTLPAGIHALSAILRTPGSASDTPVVMQVVDVPLVCN
jgi:Beta-propeller repeat